jgi:hypothetical protein
MNFVRLQDLLLEAVLHLLDGASRAHTAKRYGFSESYLTVVKHGHKNRAVQREAQEIYSSYRQEQRSREGFVEWRRKRGGRPPKS